MNSNIEKHTRQFYHLLSLLESLPNQGVQLSQLPSSKNIPFQGVYFFREPGELVFKEIPRIVRVGTHAISSGSKSSLHERLKAHLGSKTGSGNHRGSVFRKHLGHALLQKEQYSIPTWGVGSSKPLELKVDPMAQKAEAIWEKKVSDHIGAMTILWIDVQDEPSTESMRAFIELNAIALLSNHCTPVVSASETWLGRHSICKEIRESMLWNSEHVDKTYDPAFLDVLDRFVQLTVRQWGTRSALPVV
ncbi:MAG: hypothetical protein HQM06_16280 [Magnetococcales bacterium]|nr:hypothetical protein [Magnetococcales bacterium]